MNKGLCALHQMDLCVRNSFQVIGLTENEELSEID